MEKNLLLPVPLAQALVNYLAQRPYNEVVGLLNALQQIKEEVTNEGNVDKKPA